MKKIVVFTFILLLYRSYSYAQLFKGIIKDAKTGEGLEYVNVGIIGKGIGTVSDANGQFTLPLNNNGADSLRISMVGYIPQSFLVSDFSKDFIAGKTIMLIPSNRMLAEVKVQDRKLKEAVLGNITNSKTTDAGFTSNKLGNEIGEIIKIKRSPTYLLQFNASLAHNTTDSIKLRLNFYSVKNGLPDQILQLQNIFITVKKGQGDISIDLRPYHIVVNDKFFVSLEWIENSPGGGLMFSASLFSSPIISRETSQANWEKIGIAGIGFNVLAAY